MNIFEMQKALKDGKTTSVALVTQALETHREWSHKNALGSISPLALSTALERDRERKQGRIRGPLHGIPIAIKDNILFNDFTPTTCNAYSLKDFYAPYDAPIVAAMIEAGAIILGKANLSEWAYFMSWDDMPSGYGSMHGQVKHPFDETLDPFGSSTGSAVAVKLGIVPVAVGTETNGSLMAPAYQCQIVSLKPTFGLISKRGIIPISPVQDTAGPMANTVAECAVLMDVLASEDRYDVSTLNLPRSKTYSATLNDPLTKGTIGIIHLKEKPYPKEELLRIQKLEERLKKLGMSTKRIEIESYDFKNMDTLLVEFKSSINAFLDSVSGATPFENLEDIIEFNEANKERCLKYGQSILLASQSTDGNLENPSYVNRRRDMVQRASLFQRVMEEQKLVALVTPTWMEYAPIYGNPSLCIPDGIYGNVPKAFVFVGKKYDDAALLLLGYHYYDLTR